MLKTFNAILKNNSIQWIDQTPEINLDNSVKIQITFLEEPSITETKSNGYKMAEALIKISDFVSSKFNSGGKVLRKLKILIFFSSF